MKSLTKWRIFLLSAKAGSFFLWLKVNINNQRIPSQLPSEALLGVRVVFVLGLYLKSPVGAVWTLEVVLCLILLLVLVLVLGVVLSFDY